MAPWNGTAVACADVQACRANMVEGDLDGLAAVTCQRLREHPGQWPAGAFCVCERFRYGPTCTELDSGAHVQAAFDSSVGCVAALLALWISRTRHEVALYQRSVRQHGHNTRSQTPVLRVLEIGCWLMCAQMFGYALRTAVPEPPGGFYAVKFVSKICEGASGGLFVGAALLMVSTFYHVVEQGPAEMPSGTHKPYSVIVERLAWVVTAVFLVAVTVTSMLSLFTLLNAFQLVAVGITGALYVRVQGRIATMIHLAQESETMGVNDRLKLALRRAQVMYWRARRFTLTYLLLVILQLTVGQGVTLRIDEPVVFVVNRTLTSLLYPTILTFVVSATLYLGGASREWAKRLNAVTALASATKTTTQALASAETTTK